MQRNRKSRTLLMGMKNLQSLWKSVTVPKKLNIEVPYKLPRNPTPRYIPKRSKNRYANKYTYVHDIAIQNRQKEETAPMSNNGRTGKPTVAYACLSLYILCALETHNPTLQLYFVCGPSHLASFCSPLSQFHPCNASFSS